MSRLALDHCSVAQAAVAARVPSSKLPVQTVPPLMRTILSLFIDNFQWLTLEVSTTFRMRTFNLDFEFWSSQSWESQAEILKSKAASWKSQVESRSSSFEWKVSIRATEELLRSRVNQTRLLPYTKRSWLGSAAKHNFKTFDLRLTFK